MARIVKIAKKKNDNTSNPKKFKKEKKINYFQWYKKETKKVLILKFLLSVAFLLLICLIVYTIFFQYNLKHNDTSLLIHELLLIALFFSLVPIFVLIKYTDSLGRLDKSYHTGGNRMTWGAITGAHYNYISISRRHLDYDLIDKGEWISDKATKPVITFRLVILIYIFLILLNVIVIYFPIIFKI